MNALDELFAIRRVLVAFDASTQILAAIEAAVELARRTEAELEGLFVEDIDLMRLAELPLAQQLSISTGLLERLDIGALERDMRALAAEARRLLEQRAEAMNVRSSFRIVRGRTEAEVGAAAGEVDLVVIETAGRPLSLRAAASTARPAARSVLLLRGRPPAMASVIVLYDGTEAGGRALAAAARLGRALEQPGAPALTVLCFGADAAAAHAAEKKARDLLAREDVAARFHRLPKGGVEDIAAAARKVKNALLVVPADAEVMKDDGGRLLESGLPVLLVR